MDSLDLSPEKRAEIAHKKATCPFIGPAVNAGLLAVFNSAERPLAQVEEVARLGDMGGGDLGRHVLALFASGNHRRLPDAKGNFASETPQHFFSLDFPGSQGAHAGDSDILLADHDRIDSGRFSAADFDRLADHADADGLLTMEAVGAFIAENLTRDKAASVLPLRGFARDIGDIFGGVFERIRAAVDGEPSPEEMKTFVETLTKLSGEDNLVGSAGEFGLLFAFFANRPKDAQQGDGIPVAEVRRMMSEMVLPEGWETWPKRASDWVRATATIAHHAREARHGKG